MMVGIRWPRPAPTSSPSQPSTKIIAISDRQWWTGLLAAEESLGRFSAFWTPPELSDSECVSDIPVKEKIYYQGLIDSKGEEGMQLAIGRHLAK